MCLKQKPCEDGQNWSNMLIFDKQMLIYAYVVLWRFWPKWS